MISKNSIFFGTASKIFNKLGEVLDKTIIKLQNSRNDLI